MEFFPTKGIEYLMVLGYLALFLPFWALAIRRGSPQAQPSPALAPTGARFLAPEGFFFHRGHTWAQPEEPGVVRVGIDDFAQHLLGRPDQVLLPSSGSMLQQGERGWAVKIDGHEVPLLSPIQGQVLEVNEEAREHPELVTEDPYGRGWLLKVRAASCGTALKNLLPHRLARTWMDQALDRIGRTLSPELGVALQDGGMPVSGLARQVAGERWPQVCAELLLTDSGADVDA